MTTATVAPVFEASRLRGIGLVLITVAIFSCLDTMSKYLSQLYPVPGLVWFRYLVHMLLMLAILGPRLRWRLVRSAYPALQVVRSWSRCFRYPCWASELARVALPPSASDFSAC
jgi:drug/metabolite transporter (DMT)-like permease